jgi:cytochrome c peroxidase
MGKTQLDADLTDTQVQDIVAFLNALTGDFPKQTMPRIPNTSNFTVTPDP